MIRLLATLSILVALSAVAAAADPTFRYSKPIEVPTLTQEELLSATLDSDVYAATRDGLPDLRIRSGAADVAFVVEKAVTAKSETVRNYWTAKVESAKPLDDDGLEITLHLNEQDPQPNGVRLATPLHNFEQRVRVFHSPDGQNWQPAGGEDVLFDYSQLIDVRNDTVAFPATGDRYFRIVVDEVTQELQSQLKELTRRLRGDVETQREERILIERRPFRIDRVEFWHNVTRDQQIEDRKASYPVPGFRVENDAKTQQTHIHVASRREPLTAFKLVTKSNNFSRQAHVEVKHIRGGNDEWRPIGSSSLSRLDFRDVKREELTVSFPETRQSAYRIVIENRSSPPLAIAGVEATGNEYQTVFLADGKQPYELDYGSETAAAPDFDTAAINASLAADYKPLAVALGQQTELAGAGAAPFAFKTIINDSRVLGGLAVMLVVALGWGLFRAGRRLDGLSHDES